MVGASFGHYRITSELGRGGMGVVYAARDTRLDRDVAIKVLPSERDSPEAIERLRREARAASALSHPNICTVYDIGEHEGRPFIVMELIVGDTLASRIGGRPMPISMVLELGIAIADALDAAHARGIVHRDLKPGNIVITPRDTPKILDFGLAQRLDPDALTAVRLTDDRAVVGTFAYMSPEQARGEAVNAQSDIFAFGLVLFEMTTGRPALQGPVGTLVDRLLNRELPAISTIVPHVPAELDRLVALALERDRARRWQGIRPVLDRLREIKHRIESGAAPPSPTRAEIPSIAVLPFRNLSTDVDNEFFGDGIAEDLIAALTRLPGLRVAARSSAFSFRGRDVAPTTVGSALGVELLLDGSVRRSGQRVRVTAELTSTRDGFQLWAERFDRQLDDIFAIQDDIARAIVDALQLKLQTGRVVRRYTDNLAAYELYLRGRYHMFQRVARSFEAAKQCFDRAVALDSQYAPARAGRARLLVLMAYYGLGAAHDLMTRARSEALDVLAIDPGLGEAHGTLGCVQMLYDWNWRGAEITLQRSLECDPADVQTRAWYALQLLCFAYGRFDDAINQAREAMAYDPLNGYPTAVLSLIQTTAGDGQGALRSANQAIAQDPTSYLGYRAKIAAARALSQFDEALETAQTALELSGGHTWVRAEIATTLAVRGDVQAATEIFEVLRHESVAEGTFLTAGVAAALGRFDEAFALLHRSLEAREPILVALRLWPALSPLRGDPRLRPMLERMGVPFR
jgi:serine/threonine protein kinase/tetratricopeptide (TPR) repeat protein